MATKSRMSTPTFTIYKTLYSPTRQSGNKYIMVMVEIDSSATFVELIKNHTDAKLPRDYSMLMLHLK
ncbi:hypothetical protein ACHAW6_002411 [Cyclotella cf. meneghiniana]